MVNSALAGELFINLKAIFNPQGFNQLDNRVKKSQKSIMGLKQTLITGFTGALGVFGGATFLKSLIDTAKEVERITVRFNLMTNSQEKTKQIMERSALMANKYGVDISTYQESLSNFLMSTAGSRYGLDESITMFENFAKAIGGAKIGTEEAKGAFRGLGQVINKNKVQAQELRLQIGEKIPQFLTTFANVYYAHLKTMPERMAKLDKDLRSGAVGIEKLMEVSKQLGNNLGKNIDKSANTATFSLNRLNNAVKILQREIVNPEFINGLSALVNETTKIISTPEFKAFAKEIGRLLGFIGTAIALLLKGLFSLAPVLKFIINQAWDIFNIFALIFLDNLLSKEIVHTGVLVEEVGTALVPVSTNLAKVGTALGEVRGLSLGLGGVLQTLSSSILPALGAAILGVLQKLAPFAIFYITFQAIQFVILGITDIFQTLFWLFTGTPLDKIHSDFADFLTVLGVTQEGIDGFINGIKEAIKFIEKLARKLGLIKTPNMTPVSIGNKNNFQVPQLAAAGGMMGAAMPYHSNGSTYNISNQIYTDNPQMGMTMVDWSVKKAEANSKRSEAKNQ